MLSDNSSLISMKSPARALSTICWGNGWVAGDSARPGRERTDSNVLSEAVVAVRRLGPGVVDDQVGAVDDQIGAMGAAEAKRDTDWSACAGGTAERSGSSGTKSD